MYRGLGAPELPSFDIDLIITKAEGHASAKHISRVSKGHVETKSWLSESLDWPRSALCRQRPRVGEVSIEEAGNAIDRGPSDRKSVQP
jgi:hypothetical protein